jgi:hypothetical protein
MVGFEAPLGRRGVREQALKDPPTDARDASILANLNSELHRHAVGVPTGVFRECEKHGETSARAMFA